MFLIYIDNVLCTNYKTLLNQKNIMMLLHNKCVCVVTGTEDRGYKAQLLIVGGHFGWTN